MSEDINVSVPQETGETTPQTEPQTEPQAEPQAEVTPPEWKLKVKLDHKEIELDEETARTYAQKGYFADKLSEKLTAKETELSTLKERILDFEAVKLAEEKGLSIEDAKKFLTNEIEANSYRTEKAEREKQKQQEDNLNSAVKLLFSKYPDIKAEDLNNEELVALWGNGTPESFVAAYENITLKADVQSLKDKVSEYEKQLKINQVNEENSNSAVGSVTGGGETSTGSISKEDFEANKSNKEWVRKHLPQITESMKYWK